MLLRMNFCTKLVTKTCESNLFIKHESCLKKKTDKFLSDFLLDFEGSETKKKILVNKLYSHKIHDAGTEHLQGWWLYTY